MAPRGKGACGKGNYAGTAHPFSLTVADEEEENEAVFGAASREEGVEANPASSEDGQGREPLLNLWLLQERE